MSEELKLVGLKKRPQYLAVSKSNRKQVRPGLVVQYLPGQGPSIQFGLTVSGKTGGAVDRNRIKRRLKVVIQDVLPDLGKPGGTYVIIGRRAALTRGFDDLKKDLKTAILSLHKAEG